MQWHEEEDDNEFEWKDEDEEEIPAGEGSALTRMNRVATVVFLVILGGGAVYLIVRLFGAFSRYFG